MGGWRGRRGGRQLGLWGCGGGHCSGRGQVGAVAVLADVRCDLCPSWGGTCGCITPAFFHVLEVETEPKMLRLTHAVLRAGIWANWLHHPCHLGGT